MIVVGLMSGTSADGIDAALVDLTGAPPSLNWKVLAHLTLPHSAALQGEILLCCDSVRGTVDRLCRLNWTLGRAFGEAVLAVAQAGGMGVEDISLVGCHGQTVWHEPVGETPSTLQIGSPAVIAEMTGLPVVSNFRARDVAAGGQGAPLVPLLDMLLFATPGMGRAVQNIGGIGNVTYLPPDGAGTVAFDTGPGNMVMDETARRVTEGRQQYDVDGALAREGRVDHALVEELLNDAYFHKPPPKTTGRDYFGVTYAEALWERGLARGLTATDVVATATALTAASIAHAYHRWLPQMPQQVIVSGGGTANPVLMTALKTALAPVPVLNSDTLGIPSAAKEAMAVAVLAYETWHHRPGNVPAATGAQRAVILGDLTPGQPVPVVTAANGGGGAVTETANPATAAIDTVSTADMVRLINAEDQTVAGVVATQLPVIAAAIDEISARMGRGGRLIYAGAGTSGRLGLLDAAECLPTFGVTRDQVLGLLAGGPGAMLAAAEDAEDNMAQGEQDIVKLGLGRNDTLVGIAASGETPYVRGAMAAASALGALVVSVACRHPSSMAGLADLAIAPVVGAEVIAGSTRMKAGTAQKMVLNMLSTGVMIRLGKTYGNLMVDVQPTNAKLRIRARRLVETICGITEDEAEHVLAAAQGNIKVAVVTQLGGVMPAEARHVLNDANGNLRLALESVRQG
ncbi:MAG: hypothetical protein NVS2B7_02910 [Herpetosiphon sp.]